MSHAGTDSFPKFADGDTVIVLSPKKQYQLHSNILRTHSSLFAKMLIPENSTSLNGKSRHGSAGVVFRMELEMPLGGQEGVGHMKMMSHDDHIRTLHSAFSLINTCPASPIEPDLHNHWDNLFRALYSQQPTFNSKSLNTVLKDIVGLIDVAEHSDSIKSISLTVDNALVRQGQKLFQSMSERPVAWIDLMYRLKSELLFREALIHFVGQWPQLSVPRGDIDADDSDLRSKMPHTWTLSPGVRIAATQLHEEGEERKRAIESRIMGHYPPTLMDPDQSGPNPAQQHNLGPGSVAKRNHPGAGTRRIYHSQKVLHWLALGLFRHWFGQHLATDYGRTSSDGGYRFYNHLAEGGEAYLDHVAREEYLQQFPVSRKARTLFDAALNEIKEGVKPFVAELVKNNSMLDTKTRAITYLTCAKPGKRHVPWLNEAEDAHVGGLDVDQDDPIASSLKTAAGGTKKPRSGRPHHLEPMPTAWPVTKKRTLEESHIRIGPSTPTKRTRFQDGTEFPIRLTRRNLKKISEPQTKHVSTPTDTNRQSDALDDEEMQDCDDPLEEDEEELEEEPSGYEAQSSDNNLEADLPSTPPDRTTVPFTPPLHDGQREAESARARGRQAKVSAWR